MIKRLLLVIGLVLVAVLASGCMNAPVKETAPNNTSVVPQNAVRYVEIQLLDGTQVGGKYVSETPAFTTIDVLYTINLKAYAWDANKNWVRDPDKYLVVGNGAEVSIKNSLINAMVTINDPDSVINATKQELATEVAASNKAAEDKAKQIEIDKQKYMAEQAARAPTGHA